MTYSGLDPHQRAGQADFGSRSVADLLRRAAAEHPDADFIVFPKVDLTMTFGELYRLVGTTAAGLKGRGLDRGDRVCLLFRNSPEFIALYFACLACGLVVVPINPDISVREVLFIIENSNGKAVFGERVWFDRLREAGIAEGRMVHVPGFPDLGLELDTRRAAPSIDALIDSVQPTDDAIILYTSGTTGNPKGVVLSHLNFLADAHAIARWFEFGPSTRTLCMLPLFHNNGQVTTLLAPLSAGGSTVIIDARAGLLSLWGLAEKYGVTFTSVMPSMLSALLTYGARRADSTMRAILCGGQVLTAALQQKFEETFGVPVFEGYGLTETTSFSCINGYPAERRKAGSIGLPLPVNEMSVRDDSGRELPAGTEGEIWIRGLNVTRHYHNLPAENTRRFAEGWFHTGDFGHRDETGAYFFSGRKDDLIIKGGENIYPAELENVLFMHPAVAECAVIGIPDPVLGEDLCAFVELKTGQEATEQELKAFCQGLIAAFKRPRQVVVLDPRGDLPQIPKGPTRKVLYRVLRDYYRTHIESAPHA